MKKLNRQLGFTMIEIAVAGAIMAGVGVMVSQFLLDINRQVKGSKQGLDLLSLHSQITRLVRDRDACFRTFDNSGNPIQVTQTADIQTINGVRLLNSGQGFNAGAVVPSIRDGLDNEVFQVSPSQTVPGYPEFRIDAMRAFRDDNISGELKPLHLVIEYRKVDVNAPNEDQKIRVASGVTVRRLVVTLNAVFDSSGVVQECYQNTGNVVNESVRNSCYGIGVVLDEHDGVLRCIHHAIDLNLGNSRLPGAGLITGASNPNSNAARSEPVNICGNGRFLNKVTIVPTSGQNDTLTNTTHLVTSFGMSAITNFNHEADGDDSAGAVHQTGTGVVKSSFDSDEAPAQFYRFHCHPISLLNRCGEHQLLWGIRNGRSICTEVEDLGDCQGPHLSIFQESATPGGPPVKRCIPVPQCAQVSGSNQWERLIPVYSNSGTRLERFECAPLRGCSNTEYLGHDASGNLECKPFPNRSCTNVGEYLIGIERNGKPICGYLPSPFLEPCKDGYYLKGYTREGERQCRRLPYCSASSYVMWAPDAQDVDEPSGTAFNSAACVQVRNTVCGADSYSNGMTGLAANCTKGNAVCKVFNDADRANPGIQIFAASECPGQTYVNSDSFRSQYTFVVLGGRRRCAFGRPVAGSSVPPPPPCPSGSEAFSDPLSFNDGGGCGESNRAKRFCKIYIPLGHTAEEP